MKLVDDQSHYVNVSHPSWPHNQCSADLHNVCILCLRRSVSKCDHLHVGMAGVKLILDV